MVGAVSVKEGMVLVVMDNQSKLRSIHYVEFVWRDVRGGFCASSIFPLLTRGAPLTHCV
jgi:hypothetical protein